MTTVRTRAFGIIVLVVLAIAAFIALVVVPPDAAQGDAQRLMYVHVPSVWTAYLAFGVTTVASVLVLLRKERAPEWDLLAGASAEVGLLFTSITLVSGALWGKPIWGTYWTWDARLTSTAILFFLYCGYLVLRRLGTPGRGRTKRNAIVALIAFADVPIVHQSVEWWTTLHQRATVFDRRLGESNMSGSMAWTLIACVLAFTLTYVYLVTRRRELLALEERAAANELAIAIRARVGEVAAV